MSGDIQNGRRHAHSPWSVMNAPADHFAGGNGDEASSRPSPRKVELQGPRPTALKVNKDSYKIRKPPIHPPQNQKEGGEGREKQGNSHQEHKPVIIYAVSPKVIHTTVGDFMSVVQRLTGPDPATPSYAGGGGGGDVSPAARLASIERTTISSPPGNRNPNNDQLSLMASGGGALQFDGGNCTNSGLLDDILRDYSRIPSSDADGAGIGTRGILSPAPGSMPPPISPGFFTSAAMDPFSIGNGINPFGFSPSAAGLCWSPAMVSPSPTSASFDIFNPFFDF